MAYRIMATGTTAGQHALYKMYEADSRADLAIILEEEPHTFGNKCLVTTDSSVHTINSDGTWVEL